MSKSISIPPLCKASFDFGYDAAMNGLTAKLVWKSDDGYVELTSRVKPDTTRYYLPQNQTNKPIEIIIIGLKPQLVLNPPRIEMVEMPSRILSESDTLKVIGFEDSGDGDFNDVTVTCVVSL